MILLNEHDIRRHLIGSDIENSVTLHIFNSIDSTNRYLNDLPVSTPLQNSKFLTQKAELVVQNNTDVCCAEEQTHGCGRFGREWFSPFAENVYCSSRWSLGYEISKLATLSLVTSLAVMTTLQTMGISDDIAIKWPNDLLWRGKKLCGILVELSYDRNGEINAIIGIGLNVNSASQSVTIQSQLDRPWCSLFEITGHHLDRNILVAQLMIQLSEYIGKLMGVGFTELMPLWKQWDYLDGQQIMVSHTSGTICGVARGVNNIGQLILVDERAMTRYLSSGETSLRI
ncbi:MAG: biotin--[acetyl-CoA-carboxylase] ligase [Legionellaceae bacterium]|nr:biotin--[acetyl-CoA-carboxylase] ligase [Legionellaceae bacterium]